MQTVSMIGSSRRTVRDNSYSNRFSKRNEKLHFPSKIWQTKQSGKVLRTYKRSEKNSEQTLGLKSLLEEGTERLVLQ